MTQKTRFALPCDACMHARFDDVCAQFSDGDYRAKLIEATSSALVLVACVDIVLIHSSLSKLLDGCPLINARRPRYCRHAFVFTAHV
jgi:hypothetical protein